MTVKKAGFIKDIAFIILLSCTINNAKSQAQNFTSIDAVLNAWQNDTLFRHVSWGFKAVNLSGNKTIAEYNAQKSLIPASVMKLVTTGTGFLLKGHDASFETELQFTGDISPDSILLGDLIIYGKGDPTLGSVRFKAQQPENLFFSWTEEIRKKGIKKIAGNIVADPYYYTGELIPDGWTWGDIGNYFGAGVYGLNFMENEYKVVFEKGNSIGEKAVIRSIEPEILNITFTNAVTVAGEHSGDQTMIYSAPNRQECTITGTIPIKKNGFTIRGSMPDPPLVLATAFYQYLNDNNIHVTGNALSRARQEEKPITFYRHNPVSYAQIAYWTNMKSVNLYAEALLLSLNDKRDEANLYKKSIEKVIKLLQDSNISTSGFKMTDGSGLSRSNYLSPEFLCDFLKVMYRSKSFQEFNKTLPVAGASGTLSGICKGSFAENNLRAKSGSMEGVRAYAGYVENRKGETICFSVILNNFDCKQSVITKKIERLLIALAESE